MTPIAMSQDARHVSPARLLQLLPALLCIGCSSIPHRTIFVADERGKPVSGANVIPYPVSLLPFGPGSKGNSTDIHGRVELYDVTPGYEYTVSAQGFIRRTITFPQHDNARYTLKRAN